MRQLRGHLLVGLMILCGAIACTNKSSRVYDDGGRLAFSDAEREEVTKDVDRLARGKDLADIEGMAIYSETVSTLTNRGSRIEPQLIEILVAHGDWAVRKGVIEVLGSIGTRRSVEPLITATNDAVPLVALYAHKVLQAMTGFRPIPAAGEPTAVSGLPPVPQRAPDNLEMDAEERLWAMWHRDYGKLLQATWQTWWKENRGTADLK